jgi:AcrR family transcriptional regulator
MAETRRRIVDAAVDLHTTVGPARTSLAAVAARAAVQRHTLYAHFPERRSLFAACSAHWEQLHPLPDPGSWRTLEDALGALYSWFEQVEDDFALFRRDMQLDEDVREIQEGFGRQLATIRDRFAGSDTGLRRAAIGHALQFETWRSLRRDERLARDDAVQVMLRFVASV